MKDNYYIFSGGLKQVSHAQLYSAPSLVNFLYCYVNVFLTFLFFQCHIFTNSQELELQLNY